MRKLVYTITNRWVAVVVIALGLGCVSLTAYAQKPDSKGSNVVISAVFSAPKNPIDYNRYTHPEECYQLVRRVLDSVSEGMRQDTMKFHLNDTLPFIVTRSARACSERYPVESVKPFQVPILFELAMLSDNDVLIRNAVEALIRNDTSQTDLGRARAINRIMQDLLRGKPVRLALLTELKERVNQMGDDALYIKAQNQGIFTQLAWLSDNLDEVLASTKRELEYYQRIPANTTTQQEQTGVEYSIEILRGRIGWIAYLQNFQRPDYETWVKHSKVRMDSKLIGSEAPELDGDYWFGTKSATAPTVAAHDSVSIVVFASREIQPSFWAYGNDWLKRVKQAFPAVRIFIVSATEGMYMNMPLPLEPEREAKLVSQFYLDALGLPAMLTVSKREFETYHTGRKIELPLANEERYETPLRTMGRAFVVDKLGRIVYVTSFVGDASLYTASEEKTLSYTLTRLLKQPVGAKVQQQVQR